VKTETKLSLLQVLNTLDLDKAPTKYVLSLFQQCRRVIWSQFTMDGGGPFDATDPEYIVYENWRVALKKVLSTRENITKKTRVTQKRNLGRKRK
jgi:hypothetical protein